MEASPAVQQVSVVVPAGVTPGSTFQMQTEDGQAMVVTCPPGVAPGGQIQVAIGGGIAPTAGGDAVAEYERLLAASSHVVIRTQGGSQKPAVATVALNILSGPTASGTLLLVVNIDPKATNPGRMGYLRNVEPYGAFRTELKLSDGRVVMNLTHPGFSAAALTEQYSGRGMSATSVQVMDRDGPTTISFEDMDPRVRQTMGCAALCDPLLAFPKTRVTHPGSSDEAVRQGYLQIATWRVNSHRRPWDAFMLCCMVATFFSGPVCVSCCCADPDVIFELQEAGSGEAVEGVRYTERGRTCCGKSWGDHTSGNVIELRAARACRCARTWSPWWPFVCPWPPRCPSSPGEQRPGAARGRRADGREGTVSVAPL